MNGGESNAPPFPVSLPQYPGNMGAMRLNSIVHQLESVLRLFAKMTVPQTLHPIQGKQIFSMSYRMKTKCSGEVGNVFVSLHLVLSTFTLYNRNEYARFGFIENKIKSSSKKKLPVLTSQFS